ncbi:MAG: aspartate/glutamate racemase family protein [Albidovulum sp.]|nr:aspartate/glutamate racemase family protein [Albidovulum sp.]
MREIFVLNPNGSARVTASIDRCVQPLRAAARYKITCGYIPTAPEGIESDDHVEEVMPMVLDRARDCSADAIVVACFSDPGVEAARTLVAVPVIGIAEAAYYAALQLGRRFGVISLGPASVSRHARHIEKLEIAPRLAGDRPVNMSVSEANSDGGITQAVIEAGMELRDRDGADVVILGCAGMGKQRDRLQAVLGLPVVDPVQAAVATAASHLDLGYFGEGC